MRACRIAGILSVAFALSLGAAALFAQKVQTDLNKSANIPRFKTYAWGKNYILTHQRPKEQQQIYDAIVNAIDRDLQKKGYVATQEHPDMIVVYNAGAVIDAKVGSIVDPTGGPTETQWRSDSLGTPQDLWVSTVSKLQIIISDASTKKAVFTSLATKKFRDPNKAMNNMDAEIGSVVDKSLAKFPARKAG